MTSDPRYDIQPQPASSSPQPQSTRPSLDIRRPSARPLPENRPIASNNTEDMDDMLGYLD
ncbi:MAG: hypothetical protein AAF289_09960 [Cyanobacteria bacterium P01_A01_bin.135]